jgi:general secretion pathway protein C
VAIVVLIVARGVVIFVSSQDTPASVALPYSPAITPSNSGNVDLSSIERTNLFGKTITAAADSPTTTKELTLVGVLSAADEKAGLAMISSAGTGAKTYRVGEQVQGGTRLFAVLGDRVLLDSAGSIEILQLAQRPGFAMIQTPPESSTAALFTAKPPPRRDAPGLLNQVMKYSELRTDGRLRAIQISPATDGKVLRRLGIRPGDLLIAVNGISVEAQHSGENVLNKLGNSDDASVTIVRNGTRQQIELNLRQLTAAREQ